MSLDLALVTKVVAGSVAALTLCAAFVPQWVVLTPNAQVGLRQMCRHGECSALAVHTVARATEHGDNVGMVARRLRVTETFVWLGSVLAMAAIALLVLKKKTPLLHVANALSCISFIICMSVGLSITRVQSLREECTNGDGCYYYGASAIAGFIALFAAFAALVCGFVNKKFALLFALLASSFGVAAALSPNWFERTSGAFGMNSVISVGTLQTCAGVHCSSVDYSDMLNVLQTTCQREPETLRDRFATATAMLILAFIFAVCTLVTNVRAIFSILTASSALVAIAIVGDTIDFWLNCGEQFAYVQMVKHNMTASWGISFAFCLTSVLAMGVLAIAHIANYFGGGSEGSERIEEPIKN